MNETWNGMLFSEVGEGNLMSDYTIQTFFLQNSKGYLMYHKLCHF